MWIRFSRVTTLTSSSIGSYGEAFGAGAVIGSHGIVTEMRAGIPCGTLIFIWKKKQDPVSMEKPYFQGVIKVGEANERIQRNRKCSMCHRIETQNEIAFGASHYL